jgi:hypothetical protein
MDGILQTIFIEDCQRIYVQRAKNGADVYDPLYLSDTQGFTVNQKKSRHVW